MVPSICCGAIKCSKCAHLATPSAQNAQNVPVGMVLVSRYHRRLWPSSGHICVVNLFVLLKSSVHWRSERNEEGTDLYKHQIVFTALVFPMNGPFEEKYCYMIGSSDRKRTSQMTSVFTFRDCHLSLRQHRNLRRLAHAFQATHYDSPRL